MVRRILNLVCFVFFLSTITGCTGEEQSPKKDANASKPAPQKEPLQQGAVAKPAKKQAQIAETQSIENWPNIKRDERKVDIQLELNQQISMVHDDILNRKHDIKKLTYDVAKHDVECEVLADEVAARTDELKKLQVHLKLLQEHLKKNPEKSFVGTDNKEYTSAQIRIEIARRLELYKSGQKVLNHKKKQLEAGNYIVKTAKERLEKSNLELVELETKLADLRAKLVSKK